MNSFKLETPLHTFGDLLVLYSGIGQVSGGETPLPTSGLAEDRSQALLVQRDVIHTYQRMIFELQQEILRYKTHLDSLLRQATRFEEPPAILSTPLSAS